MHLYALVLDFISGSWSDFLVPGRGLESSRFGVRGVDADLTLDPEEAAEASGALACNGGVPGFEIRYRAAAAVRTNGLRLGCRRRGWGTGRGGLPGLGGGA